MYHLDSLHWYSVLRLVGGIREISNAVKFPIRYKRDRKTCSEPLDAWSWRRLDLTLQAGFWEP